MSATKISKGNFSDEVMHAKGRVLLDFYAEWCGPCRMVGPVVDEIADQRHDVKVCKINVEEERELAEQFGIMSIPTLVVMKDGKVVKQASGARSKADILAMLN